MTMRWALLALVGPAVVLLGVLGAQLYQLLGPVLLVLSVAAVVVLARSCLRPHR